MEQQLLSSWTGVLHAHFLPGEESVLLSSELPLVHDLPWQQSCEALEALEQVLGHCAVDVLWHWKEAQGMMLYINVKFWVSHCHEIVGLYVFQWSQPWKRRHRI